jgi:hypothetical protein
MEFGPHPAQRQKIQFLPEHYWSPSSKRKPMYFFAFALGLFGFVKTGEALVHYPIATETLFQLRRYRLKPRLATDGKLLSRAASIERCAGEASSKSAKPAFPWWDSPFAAADPMMKFSLSGRRSPRWPIRSDGGREPNSNSRFNKE